MSNEPKATWREVSDLQKCSLSVLQEEYQKHFAKPSKSRSREKLVAAIAKRIQEETKDSAPASVLTSTFRPTRKCLTRKEKAPEKKKRNRTSRAVGSHDSRIPKSGSTITKKYKGKTIYVRVKDKGFEYAGSEYRSLSAVAKKVTGSIWNGFLFFGLVKRQPAKI